MSSIVTERGVLHYQTIGQGKPFILLHGWINSWNVWRDSMMRIADEGNYKVYALDFWGFGESSRRTGDDQEYSIASFVDMVYQLMENLGIPSAPIAGHSMGGTVALLFALTHPQKSERVIVIGSPIRGSTMHPMLKLAGFGWIASFVWRFPVFRTLIMHLILAGDSESVRKMIFRDIERASLNSFFRSIEDLRRTDLRDRLSQLELPTLGIYGVNDNIVSPSNAILLSEGAKTAKITMFKKSRHFPMADQPAEFASTIGRFLTYDNPN
ncbi:MAG: alpha/beta hydrolase [Candidatus Promineifilaceae bacterium]